MDRKTFSGTLGKATLACAFSTILAFQAPGIALAATKAELQQQVAAAQQRLYDLNSQAEMCEYDLMNVTKELDDTVASIGELDTKIPESQEKLTAAQDELALLVSEDYKNGTPTLLDVVVGSTSFDDMVSRVVYANKISEHEREAVDKVKTLADELDQQKSDLETKKADQERLVDEQKQRLSDVEAAAASAESYYGQLSVELQQAIAEEQAAARAAAQAAAAEAAAAAQARAEEEAAAAEEAAQAAESAQPQSSDDATQDGNSTSSSSSQQQDAERAQQAADEAAARAAAAEEEAQSAADAAAAAEEEAQSAPVVTPTPTPTPSSSTKTNAPSAYGSSMVARAYSIIGSGYSWSGYNWTGDVGSSSFTCSGVVDYALGLPSHSNSPESLWAQVGSNMVYDSSQLNYGDLVFYPFGGHYPTGHVGIYVGGGMIIDSIPNGGVALRDVNYMTFLGGGPL